MEQVRLNGEPMDARPGETLLAAARRHGANVWFLCDGRGICQTCACRVRNGGEHLSPPTELERTGLGTRGIDQGYRLGCQAHLAGTGPVAAESRVQELLDHARAAAAAEWLQPAFQRWVELNQASMGAAIDFARGVAAASPYTLSQLLRHPPTPGRVASWTWDGWRLVQRLLLTPRRAA